MALPVDTYIPAVRDALAAARAVVIVAAPGAGKTTRVPPALVDYGPVILLQPRRVAARTIARRIADEEGWTLGREVGWHVRLDRRFSTGTRLLVATEGVLTARLQQDPLLLDFGTIVLDEFHERSIHADLGIGLARQAWLARDDLRLVIMSATMDAEKTAAFLDDCPIIDVPGRTHSLDVQYRPGASLPDAVAEVLDATSGSILCFLPGAREVRRAALDVRARIDGVEVIELHGSLAADEQDRALRAVSHRRIIVATNIAETSLTVPSVHGVVDGGYEKVARYDAARGIDSLEIERISADSAVQRAGRAGRLGPGVVRRLWSETDRLRPHAEPEIARVDLAGVVLDLLAWGGDPRSFEWFEKPTADRLDDAFELLVRLGAVRQGRLTELGREMSRMPVHPRLARILLESGGASDAALGCAILSERLLLPQHPDTTDNDLARLLDRDAFLPPHVREHARQLERLVQAAVPSRRPGSLRRAILAGYPDRVGKRRTPGDARVLMCGGYGATVGPESGVRDGDFLVAVDLQAGRRGEHSEARIRIASLVDRDWLTPTGRHVQHELSPDGTVRAFEREFYGAIILKERPAAIDATQAAALLGEAYLSRPMTGDDLQLERRLRFAGLADDLREVVNNAVAGRTRLADVRLLDGLDPGVRQQLERLAPRTFTAPSGRTHVLEYREDGSVLLSIKLQELFGLAETPRIGTRRVPLLIELLAPNGRPVQTTRDLRNFWNTTYPEVRKELRGRYPKHPWPEDPWNATPTARTTRAAR